MPSAVPVMHFAVNENGLPPGNWYHEVRSNFWPQQEALFVHVVNDNLKELVRMGYYSPSLSLACFTLLTSECRHKRKQLTVHLMSCSPRAMIPKMKMRLAKLNHITDYVITFMLYPDRKDVGMFLLLPASLFFSLLCVMLNLFQERLRNKISMDSRTLCCSTATETESQTSRFTSPPISLIYHYPCESS